MRRREFLLAAGALAAPLAASHAQAPRALPRVALVDTGAVTSDMTESRHPYWGQLLTELRRRGHVEGQSIGVDRWSAGGASTTAAYQDLARRIVASAPTVIVARGRSTLAPIAAGTRSIPIVAIGTIPPELRASYSRPGGNVTGIDVGFDSAIYGKQVEVLRDVLKPAARIAWLGPKSVWDSVNGEAARKAVDAAGVALRPFFVSPINRPTLRRAFADMSRARVDGVLVSPATEFFAYRDSIAELAVSHKLPSLGSNRLYAGSGMLLSYGTDLEHLYRQAAHYVDQILKGVAPGVLPIERPEKIEFIVNLETAKELGIQIPASVLARADRVIE